MRGFAKWLTSPVGQVIRDIVEGGIAGALAAVIALQLDVATPQVIWAALLTGFISAAIAVARRKLVGANVPPPPSAAPQ
jgi:uncharacterized membrane protein YeaQ/YmgE (transglycosylase-associated protein family)